jgi:hypothetical protein
MSRKFIFGGSYASAVLLLDLYPATVAYSLRKIRTGVTNLVRVRRSGDNAELDFTETTINDGSLLSWVVAGGGTQNGFITKWYNQGTGGATYDASQTGASFQPFIVESGVLKTVNTKASIKWGNGTQGNPMVIGASFNYKTFLGVAKVDSQNTVNYLLGNEAPATGVWWNGSAGGVNGIGAFDGTNARSLTGEDLNQHLGYLNMRSGNLYASKDGASETNTGTFAASLTSNLLGGRTAASILYFIGNIQEVILYTNDESANKTAIETNINSYYGIY